VAKPPVDDESPGRRTAREARQDAVARAQERAQETAERARLTFRRLSGLDRSGPPPPQTLRGQPLNPWTLPNAIGYVRLLLVPVFLAFAFSHGDGKSTTAVVLFAVVAWSDYLDGITARLTGQYSRMGALLDPLVDRLLVISGVVVCWRFELLPRWALAVLVAREVFMLGLVRYALRVGADVKVNWLGRAGVWPVLVALFAGMAGLKTFGEICLYLGLGLVLGSTAQYVREGFRYRAERRAGRPSSSA
jgi:CDP-diacylglycerol--glycerol-3-phosphate 3-phosphatidyltransferase